MSEPRARSRRWAAATAGAAIVVGGFVAAGAFANPTSTDSATATKKLETPNADRAVALDERPTLSATGLERHYFDDLATMTATAPLVISGHVVSVEPGRYSGGPPGERDRVRDVTIAVDDVIANRSAAAPDTVTVDEWGWDSQGRGFQMKGVTWTEPGDEGVWFLTPVSDAPGHHRLINSQGRVLTNGDEIEPSAQHDDDIYVEIAKQSTTQFSQSIRQHFHDFRTGRVQPQQPL